MHSSRVLLALLLVPVLAALICVPARAHTVRPAIVAADFDGEGNYRIEVSANLEALLAEIGPEHADSSEAPGAALYNSLRTLAPDALRTRFERFAPRWLEGVRVEFDGRRQDLAIAEILIPPVADIAFARVSIIRIEGQVPAGARHFRWAYAERFGSSILRVSLPGAEQLTTAWLNKGKASDPIPLTGVVRQSRLDLFAQYVGLGFAHILPKGLDHILFVLGLYLLSTRMRPLLTQVTAFTVAHSITLALGLYGVVRISPAIVEPLIALSIVYVAVENLLTSRLTLWRPIVVFCFGLLHGLGFAGVLQEIGLPRAEFVTGLIAFNVGVELGQLAVIALAFVVAGLWFSAKPWYRGRIVVPASLLIALTGLYWTVDRVFFT